MKPTRKIAFGTALVVFLVLAGTGVSSALWSTTATTSSTVKFANLADACTNVTSVINASFEEPYRATLTQTPDNLVPGWEASPDNNIEIWVDGFNGVPAPVGRQFVELNAHVAGTLSQTISTTPGQTLQWSLLHRGRLGIDTMAVLIGAPGSTLVSQGNISDGVESWNRYSGAYVVPAGQTQTQLSFRAVSTATGDQSIGNFLDDVSFGSGPCLTAVSTAVQNETNPGGAVRVGDTLRYETTVRNVGSSPALQTVVGNTLPTTLQYVLGSLTVGGTARTDAAGDDVGQSVNSVITARLGTGATATAGGALAQNNEMKYSFRAIVQSSAAGTTIDYMPTATSVNGLAQGWPITVTAANMPVTVALGADLALASSVSPATVNRGSTTIVTWTFTVTNNGPASASGAKLRISVPSTVTTVAAPTGTGVTCAVVTNSPRVYDCTATAAVPVGAQGAITMTGRVATAQIVGSTHAPSGEVSATTTDPNTANNTSSSVVTVDDSQAPGSITNLAASGTSVSQTTLNWTAPTDNVAVTSYDIYRNGVFLANATGTTYTSAGLTASTTYTYYVRARDLAGNVGAQSNTVTVTTAANTTRYQIRNTGNNLCLDSDGGGTAEGTRLIQYTCYTTWNNQRWIFTPTTNGYFRMSPAYQTPTALAWTLNTGNNATFNDGRQVDMRSYTGADSQQWLPVQQPNGSWEFVNRASGKCLDVNGQSNQLGLAMQQWTCNDTVAQRWTLTMVQ